MRRPAGRASLQGCEQPELHDAVQTSANVNKKKACEVPQTVFHLAGIPARPACVARSTLACPLPRSLLPPLQLMTPAAVLSRTNGREQISRGDVEEVHALFRWGQARELAAGPGPHSLLLVRRGGQAMHSRARWTQISAYATASSHAPGMLPPPHTHTHAHTRARAHAHTHTHHTCLCLAEMPSSRHAC